MSDCAAKKTFAAYFSRVGRNYVSGDIVELRRGNDEAARSQAAVQAWLA